MKKPVAIFFKFQGALALGTLVSFGMMQQDPWLVGHTEKIMSRMLSETVGVPFTLKIERLSILTGQIVARSIRVASAKGDWSFKAPTAVCNVSLFSLLRGKEIEAELIFVKPEITTLYENKKAAIEDPIRALINAPPTIPLKLIRCAMQNFTLRITASFGELMGVGSGSIEIGTNSVLTTIFLTDGSAKRFAQELAQRVSGLVTVDVPIKDPESYKATVHVSCYHSPDLKKRCIFYAEYKDRTASCSWYPEDRTLHIKGEHIRFNDEDVRGNVKSTGQLDALADYFPIRGEWKSLHGTGSFEGLVKIVADNVEYEGTAHAEDIDYKGFTLANAMSSVKGTKQSVGGLFTIDDPRIPLEGSWSYAIESDELKSHLQLTKPSTIIPQLRIEKKNTSCDLTAKNGHLSLKIAAEAFNRSKEKINIKGSMESDMSQATFKGSINQIGITGSCLLDPLKLLQITGKDTKGRVILNLHDTGETLSGSGNFEALKDLLNTLTGYQLQGTGTLVLKVQTSPLKIDVALEKAQIKLPSTYNFITGLKGSLEYDSALNLLKVQDVAVDLHKGRIILPHSCFMFNTAGDLEFAHIPFAFENLFVSWHKDLFATLSGHGTALYNNGRWIYRGIAMIDKATLRGNLLSWQVQKDLVSTSGSSLLSFIDLALSLQTVAPVEVKTPFFQTKAQLNASLFGTASKPQMSGVIELHEGIFDFPYKPLYITSGKLFLNPVQPDDPLISLTAKNKIKKYAITMQVSGTLHQPKITLESSPALPEENILTLLLSGSDEGSLFAAMPHMVMLQLEHLLFGSGEKMSKAQQFFKNLLKPLKNVRFVPKMSDDQSNKVQGAIEVDINDRLRAKAQNSLNLSDETQVEVEYSLTDDMSIKAVRDKEGGLGGELEMRWKF